MQKEKIEADIQNWLDWGRACVEAASGHCHDSRVFAEPVVQALLDRKGKDPWDVSMGKDLFEVWSGPSSHAKKWNDGEWSLLKGLYLHACGPLPAENYSIDIFSDWNEGFGTSLTRKMFARLADHTSHIQNMVDTLALGVSFVLGESPEYVEGSALLSVRASFEDLFQGDRIVLPGFNEEAAEATETPQEATEAPNKDPKRRKRSSGRKKTDSGAPEADSDLEDLL